MEADTKVPLMMINCLENFFSIWLSRWTDDLDIGEETPRGREEEEKTMPKKVEKSQGGFWLQE